MIPQMQIAPMRVKAVMGASIAYLLVEVKPILMCAFRPHGRSVLSPTVSICPQSYAVKPHPRHLEVIFARLIERRQGTRRSWLEFRQILHDRRCWGGVQNQARGQCSVGCYLSRWWAARDFS